MPKTYGYLLSQGQGSNLPVSIANLIRNQTWPGGTPIPEDQYWATLMPYMTSLYPGVVPDQPAQQFQPPPIPTGAVSVSPDQLAQMRSAQAGGGMYSLLNPSLNVAPETATSGIADYMRKYTNPTAATGTDFLKSLGGTITTPSPSPNLPAMPYSNPRPSAPPASPFRNAVRPQRGRAGFGYIPRTTYGRF